jgi:hypothetical protein
MVAGVVVGVVKELCRDRLILADDTCIPFAVGTKVPELSRGSRVTIRYTRNDDGGGMLIQGIHHTAGDVV